MKKKQTKVLRENWCTEYGAIKEKYRDEFYSLAKELEPIFKKLESRMSYRELYNLARDLSVTAVGSLVVARVDKPRRKKNKK